MTRDSSTPLNIACATGASTDIIRVLLNPPPGMDDGGIAVRIPDSRGCTPLSELTIHYELQRKSPGYVRTALPLERVDLINNSISEPLLESYWIKVELLIRSAWLAARKRLGPWISMVHGAAALCEYCPTALTSLICRSYPAKAAFASHEGILPLHLAVEISGMLPKQQNGLCLVRRRTKWIQTLVELYPAGVRQPTSNGRSVFCQAIASGLHWHIGGQPQQNTDEDRVGPLQYLWKHDPAALSTPDVITELYPFLLAATVVGDGGVNQLDTIFCLLRLHPQLLENIVDTTEQQEHRFNLLIAETFSASLGQQYVECNEERNK
jgi:hypothetical protein